ncbi:MAG: sensor histidine kinase [Pseudooceanicola sp.]
MKANGYRARRGWPRGYTGKVLLAGCAGCLFPAVAVGAYAAFVDSTPFLAHLDLLAVLLAATLLATGCTILVVCEVTRPVQAAAQALRVYLARREVPRLPTDRDDEAGALMAGVQEALTRLDAALLRAEAERSAEKLARIRAARSGLTPVSLPGRPLTLVTGCAEVMKAEALSQIGGAAWRDGAGRIGKSGENVAEAVNAVLDLPRVEAQVQFARDKSEVNLADLAREAVRAEHFHADRRGVEIVLDAPQSLHHTLVAPAARGLMEVMLQFAVSRMQAGGQVRLELGGGDTVHITAIAGPAVLFREELPERQPHFAMRFPSARGKPNQGRTGTTALRLSLIEAFCHAMDADMDLVPAEEGLRISVSLSRARSVFAIPAQ